MAKPNIAILHYSCPPVIGGVEFVIEAHARLFADAGHDTRLIVGNGGSVHPKVRTIEIPEISSKGGPVANVLKALAKGKIPPFFDTTVKWVARKLSDALKGVDVCMMHNVLTMHFNLVLTAALANIIEQRKNIHFIGWIHDSTFGDSHYEIHQRREYPWSLLSQPLPGCDYCVISAQRQREIRKLFDAPALRFPIIPDGINVPELLGLGPLVEEMYHGERLYEIDLVALTPTRIVRRKNLEAGIEIVAALKKLGKSVRWLITGAPDPHNADAFAYFRELTDLRRKRRVQREVVFLCERFKERISNEDLRALYAVSDMLIYPSIREGFGIPVLEGILAGRLILIKDIPALREVGGSDAVYIRRGDRPVAVARRAIRAFEQSPLLVRRKKMISSYSWDAVFTRRILPAVRNPKSLWK